MGIAAENRGNGKRSSCLVTSESGSDHVSRVPASVRKYFRGRSLLFQPRANDVDSCHYRLELTDGNSFTMLDIY